MFTSGMSDVAAIIFSALTFTVSIPSAIKVFNWLATMYKGTISLTTPMLYALAFIFLFTIGGFDGAFLGTIVNGQAPPRYLLRRRPLPLCDDGGTLVAFLGGIFHWWPKMTGRMFNEFWGQVSAVTVLIGFKLDVLAAIRSRNSRDASPVCHVCIGVSVFASVVDDWGVFVGSRIARGFDRVVALDLPRQEGSGNPWGGATLEWTCTSPPPFYNFESVRLWWTTRMISEELNSIRRWVAMFVALRIVINESLRQSQINSIDRRLAEESIKDRFSR